MILRPAVQVCALSLSLAPSLSYSLSLFISLSLSSVIIGWVSCPLLSQTLMLTPLRHGVLLRELFQSVSISMVLKELLLNPVASCGMRGCAQVRSGPIMHQQPQQSPIFVFPQKLLVLHSPATLLVILPLHINSNISSYVGRNPKTIWSSMEPLARLPESKLAI